MSSLGTRPYALLLLALGLLAGLLAGCQAAATTPTPPLLDPGAKKPITLTLWHSQTGTARATLEGLAADLHKAYPDINLNAVYVGGDNDLSQKMVAATALGKTPDLVLASRNQIARFASQGALLPLDGFTEGETLSLSPEDRADILPGLVEEGTLPQFGRQQIAFPFDVDPMVLFYDTEMLQARSFPGPPATWPEFLDMASRATADEQYGWAMRMDGETFDAMLASQGSALIDLPGRHTLIAERGGLASITLAAQLDKSGAAHRFASRTDAVRDFASGKAAFYIDWLSALPAIQAAQKSAQANFSIGVTNLPQRNSAAPFMLFQGSDLAIMQVPAERAARAWFVIRWLTASAQTARWAQAAPAVPLRASAVPLISGSSSGGMWLSQIHSNLGGNLPHFVPRSTSPQLVDVERIAADAWNQALSGKADIGTVLKDASKRADALLAGNP